MLRTSTPPVKSSMDKLYDGFTLIDNFPPAELPKYKLLENIAEHGRTIDTLFNILDHDPADGERDLGRCFVSESGEWLKKYVDSLTTQIMALQAHHNSLKQFTQADILKKLAYECNVLHRTRKNVN